MRARLVVIDSPGFHLTTPGGQGEKPVRVQAFIAKPAVEGFDVTVLHRPARLDIAQQETVRFAPKTRRSLKAASELWIADPVRD